MSSTTSYRISGGAMLIGSVLSLVFYFLQGVFLPGNDLATIISSLSLISSVIGFVGSVLVLPPAACERRKKVLEAQPPNPQSRGYRP